jgi:phosphoglycerate dehydrogenase-like enzyme
MALRIAVLDDYQQVAHRMADWASLRDADVTFFDDHASDPPALVERLKGFDVVCLLRERTPMPAAVIDKLPGLKLIATAGPYNASIDYAAAHANGTVICGTRYAPNAAPELVWGLILSLTRKIPFEDRAMREGLWQTTMGQVLNGRTLGLIGLGRVGSRVAEIGKAFGMTLIAWSQNMTDARAAEFGATRVSKEELLRTSDVVSLHLQLSARTRGIIGADELKLMKPSAYLVNTARGPLVDEAALIAALRAHTIAGAGLDVYDVEPLPAAHPLRTLPNVVITPHIGFVADHTYRIFYGDMVEDIAAWQAGAPIRVLDGNEPGTKPV